VHDDSLVIKNQKQAAGRAALIATFSGRNDIFIPCAQSLLFNA